MIAFIDLKVLVTTGEAVCYFAANGQLLTSSAIPTGAISMIIDQAGQILHNTPHINRELNSMRRVMEQPVMQSLEDPMCRSQADYNCSRTKLF